MGQRQKGRPGLQLLRQSLQRFQRGQPLVQARHHGSYTSWRQDFFVERLRLVLLLAVFAYGTFLVLGASGWAAQITHQSSSWLIMASTVEVGLWGSLVALRTRRGQRYAGLIFVASSWLITLGEQVWATLQGFALPGILAWTLVFLTQATLIPVRWPLHLTVQLGVLAYYFGVNTLLRLPQRELPILDTTYQLYLFWFCCICNLAVYLYERLQKAEFEARKDLEVEQERSELLLLNILPAAIAQQLKQDKRTIADSFSEVSVLFADIVGFTQLANRIPPVELVNLLNQIFSAFDQLAERHDLEKIKTIGDSYMVVGGLPAAKVDHAEAIAEMALDMQEALAEFNAMYNQSFSMRIGIHTGPVVAGVIGIKKFIYDLWGDTVNIASRMESHGLPDCIHVTTATYEALKHQYQFTERGVIEIKGKGAMTTYFLVGRRTALTA